MTLKKLFASCILLGTLVVTAVEVAEIKVRTNSTALSSDSLGQLVGSTIATRVGSEFSAATVSEDLKRLIKSGKFDDVRLDTETTDNGKVVVIFSVVPKPIVRAIEIQGNKYYKTNKLEQMLKLETGKQLDEHQLAEDRKALLDKYREAGYYGTEVTSSIKHDEDNQDSVQVIYVIKEEVRHKLKKVYFENNTVFEEGELRRSIQTQRQWWRYVLRFGNYFNKEYLALDKDKLKRLYGQKGYMDFAVSDVKITPCADDENWVEVTFVLDEGQPYKVGTITLEGSAKFTSQYLLEKTTTKSGDIHDSEREDLDLNLMKAEYERLGYMDLRFWPTHNKNADTHVVDVNYHVIEGGVSTIRNIEISGNAITQDNVIRRELAIAPGDLGDNGKIRSSKQRLLNIGYFETVDILPIATDVPDVKDLRIELKEKPTGQLSVGAGFSSEDSAIGFLEFSETNFDLGRLLGMEWPPKGAGQRLRARFQVGSDDSSFTISHTEPWFLDRRLELTTDVYVRNRDEDEYEQRNIGAGMMLSWPVAFMIPGTDHIENWRLGTGFHVESIEVSDVDEHDPDSITEDEHVEGHVLADEEGTETVLRLHFNITRDTRDAFQFPKRGSKISLDSELVTVYETYGRFEFNASKYMPVFSDVILKSEFDYYTTTGTKAKIFDRYFGGGIGTIRGFKRRDVAPIDCHDDPLGGNSMMIGSLELIKPVKNFMYVSTFLDAGNAWWKDFEADFGDLNFSIGLGVQFKQLPISIYYGYPISTSYDHLDGKSGRIHFNIGITY